MRLWLTGKDSPCLTWQLHGVSQSSLLPSIQFCLLHAYLSSALSKGQDSFFIQPMKATHKQKALLHHNMKKTESQYQIN